MGKTTVDHYRAGNASSARLDKIRSGEVEIFQRNGIEFVSLGSGGVSTFTTIEHELRGKWWKLPLRSSYDDRLLHVWNDFGNHWSWEPCKEMPLSDYLAALTDVNAKFVRI
jgi:hypothetical protein